MKRKTFRIISTLCFFTLLNGAPVSAAEPSMVNYCAVPPFLTFTAQPNILIMLDNSGSMNFSAYGSWNCDGCSLTDQPYVGPFVPPVAGSQNVRVISGNDDVEQRVGDGHILRNSSDLELTEDYGYHGDNQVVGIRFQGVQVPNCVTITNAYIEFNADESHSGDTDLVIQGHATDNAPGFTTAAFNVSSRPTTSPAAAVAWNNVPSWSTNNDYQTPNLANIVQEIVDRDGWQPGNSMAFIINGTGRRVAESYNGQTWDAPLLHVEWEPAAVACEAPPPVVYYGYFNSDWFYTYNDADDVFEHAYKKLEYTGACWDAETPAGVAAGCIDNNRIVNEELWDGNWMNWIASRRVDIARKVLMGGLVDPSTPRTDPGPGEQIVLFDDHSQNTGRYWYRSYNSIGGIAVSPYHNNVTYRLRYGDIRVESTGETFRLAVKKNELYEPDEFYNGNVAGVLQNVGDVARWGLEFFNSDDGGYIDKVIGTDISTLVDAIEAKKANTWTPLAESYWVAMNYFMQTDEGMGFPGTIPRSTLADDPYRNPAEDPTDPTDDFVPCADSFVILFTDGASTQDRDVPAFYRNFDNDTHESDRTYDSNGSDYLDDLALYARITDLRSATVGKSDIEDTQNLYLYPVYAFGNDPVAQALLKDAAINGGFNDKPNQVTDLYDGLPNSEAVEMAITDANYREWDADMDGDPDTYFEAQDGAVLEEELIAAFEDILNRASSGTSVSVLATSSEGEGTVVQAYFNPLMTGKDLVPEEDTAETATWVGFLHSLFVDQQGNLREDSDTDHKLDITKDKVIKFEVTDDGKTFVERYNVTEVKPYPDFEIDSPEATNLKMAQINPIWEAGKVLINTDPDSRTIYTTLDGNNFADFNLANGDQVTPFLGVKDDATWDYLGGIQWERGENLIQYVRGNDSGFLGTTRLRNRTIAEKVLRLGDIINSTPVTVADPPDRYNLIYKDESYEDFAEKYSFYKGTDDNIYYGRETVIYVGSNDGMLHAFTSWLYDPLELEFIKPGQGGDVRVGATAAPEDEEIGTELWSFIPQSILPHLKWQPDPDYCHVYTVDAKPKVADARIFTPSAKHPNGWGTVLISGMSFGGKKIEVTDDFGAGNVTTTFTSSYFAIDITDPRDPELLWERSFDNMGLSTFFPAIAKVGQLEFDHDSQALTTEEDVWYVVLGSGPSAESGTFDGFDGVSSDKGYVYIVNLETGEPVKSGGNDWLFETDDDNSYLTAAASFDKNLNYNVDAIYLSEAHQVDDDNRLGAMYKISIPWLCESGKTCEKYGQLKDSEGAIIGKYIVDPNDSGDPWTMTKLFDSPRPVTAAPSLSIDFYDAVWVYFGTGRFYNEDDKSTIDTEYLFGIKDPFFNEEHSSDGSFGDNYYGNYTDSLALDMTVGSMIMNAGELVVAEPGLVYTTGGLPWGNFDALRREQRLSYNGWYRELPDERERSLTKPVIFGGLALYSTYVPSLDICDFGGHSYLYALYFETGTANTEAVFIDGTETDTLGGGPKERVLERTDLGLGLASSPAIHAAKEEDNKASAKTQLSTGQIMEVLIDPALKVRSGLRTWEDMTIKEE